MSFHGLKKDRAKIFSLLFGLGLFAVTALHAQESRLFDKDKIVKYDERLKFYLDQQTKDYLSETAAQERLLFENIKNLTTEIKQRGIKGNIKDEAGFGQIYGDMQLLVDNYAVELDAVLAILDEIKSLSRTLETEQRQDLVEQFSSLRDSLTTVLENRKLQNEAPKTGNYKTALVREYNVEVDSLLRIYKRLEKFERAATVRNDTAAVRLTKAQKAKLQTVLAGMRTTTAGSPTTATATAYLKEVDGFVALLKQLETIEKPAEASLDKAIEVEVLRREILASLDKNLLKLFGYPNLGAQNKITIEQSLQAWRADRVTKFEVRRTQYAILKKNLIQSGGSKERSRMLNRDLADALLNYAAERYLVAEEQLATIQEDYGKHFSNWDVVRFYQAECLYGRGVLNEALGAHASVLRDYPESKFRDMMLLRVITIAHVLKRPEQFFGYYQQLEKLASTVEPKILERARYLAGYYALSLEKFGAADSTLGKIATDSKYGLAARYLQGVAQLNRGNSASALVLFKEIVAKEALPWSDPAIAMTSNSAMLKLGFIYYERGELEEALKYFDQVSRGTENYDQTLMGKAWAELRLGNVEQSLAQIQTLSQGYSISDYTYEAKVLSAHCKRLLDQPEAALRDLRYVSNAHGVLETSRDYNEERAQIVAQMNELERMEREVLEKQDASLYEIVAKARQNLQATLLNINYRGPKGDMQGEEFTEERQKILAQLQALDEVIEDAQKIGMVEVEQEALQRRNRLIKTLESYQADRSIEKVNYLVEYPLAIKESGAEHRKEVVQNLMAHLESEQQSLQADIDSLRALASAPGKKPANLSIDLKILQDNLRQLRSRMERFQTWLATYDVEEVQSDFERWADFSGFGMSDLTLQELDRREHKINTDSRNLGAIDQVLRDRRTNLEMRIKRFDDEMRRIEAELLEEQVRLDKLEHEKYFENLYFDKSESEVPHTKATQPDDFSNELLPPE
ncbi:MAG: tetratricopeptide repeat protein [candidate division KSB1 bacterium]